MRKSKMIAVSIIVPAYNAEQYIGQCMDSLVAQTLREIEIITINDGSTDKTGEILEKYAEKYENIKVYNQENKGLYKTREIGIGYAIGEYVGWVDADDFVKPTMYEEPYNAAVQNNSELAYCNYEFYPSKIKTKEKWFRLYQGKKDVTFVERNSQPWNKIVKRELLNKLGIARMFVPCFDEAYIKVLLEAQNPTCVQKELYSYRMGQPTMSSSYKNVAHYEEFIRASTQLKNEMLQSGYDNDYWNSYFEYREIYYRIMTMLVAANAKDKETYIRIKKELRDDSCHYHQNQHIHRILRDNFGWAKAIVLEWTVPSTYFIARMLCKVAFYG